MRIYTCTPVEFGGGADFFARDSGLLCRGLQLIGVQSMAVMPGLRKTEDEADLIRTNYSDLESADWWSSLHLDGVVLYAWARPKYRKVAAAIRAAGVFLILNQDHGGLVSPRAGLHPWLAEQWIVAGQGRGTRAWVRFVTRTIKGISIGLLVSDPLRSAHLECGNAIACVSPRAAAYFKMMCLRLGGADLERRVTLVPHPVETGFTWKHERKLNQIVCVGRWQDDCQKRSWLLMDVLEKLLSADDTVVVMIAGNATPAMTEWHRSLNEAIRNRIALIGNIGRNDLCKLLCESKVFFSPSAFESFGIAAAEALCCGCSVVAARSVSMTSFDWFVSEDSGTLVLDDHVDAHVHTLLEELNLWNEGKRDASTISNIWSERLHANKVAEVVVRMVELGDDQECEHQSLS